MNVATFISLIFVLLWTCAISGSSTPQPDFDCQQCNAQCPSQPAETQSRVIIGQRGPRGPHGESGEPGIKGYAGSRSYRGFKGDRGPDGVANMTAIEGLIDKRIQQAFYNLPYEEESPYYTCNDVRKTWAPGQSVESGLVDLTIPGVGQTQAYCDYTRDGGNWMIFQRRIDGQESFYRVWNEYVNGFGDREGEYWLGLEALHQLTKNYDWELRIDMESHDGVKYYAKYRKFRVGSAAKNYTLRLGPGFSGNTANSLRVHHNGQQFSTRDADHDSNPSLNCAVRSFGAWWYNDCHGIHSNLNGLHGSRRFYGISWFVPSRGWIYLKSTEMMIRKR